MNFAEVLSELKAAGLVKQERFIESPQAAEVVVQGSRVLNFCSNNYLGLADHPEVKQAAKGALDKYGIGMASVRFICGTTTLHKQLEKEVARFVQQKDAVLFSSCFDANNAVFAALLDEHDVVVSDELNHASIIDGIRLCKAQRVVYKHSDMNDLRMKLEGLKARTVLIVTDGVFSMESDFARLPEIMEIARHHRALVMIDDSHATGFVGKTGRGTFEKYNVKPDIVTSTFGKALGGAAGGFVAASETIVSVLRQKGRPYLFSNSLAPPLVGAALKALEIIKKDTGVVDKIKLNTLYFRRKIKALGFEIVPGAHPIVPVMVYDVRKAGEMAKRLLKLGVYVVAFSYPVVPKGKARIRVQLSGAHTKQQLDKCLAAFEKVGKKMKVVKNNNESVK